MASSSSSSSSNSIPSKTKNKLIELKLKLNQDYSSITFFLKCFLYGELTILPNLIRILITFISNNNNKNKKTTKEIRNLFKNLFQVIFNSFKPNSFPFAFAVTLAGTKFGEDKIEILIRKLYSNYLNLNERNNLKGKTALEGISVENKLKFDEKVIKTLTTFISSTLAALISISLLQSSSSNNKKRLLNPLTTIKSLSEENLSPSPYPSLLHSNSSSSSSSFKYSNSGISTPTATSKTINQSPTLDLTLFIFVRAADSLIRLTYEYLKSSPTFASPSPSSSSGNNSNIKLRKRNLILSLLASQADTLLFILSVSRIIWCFFYLPELLPRNYNLWIKNLARFDSRLLNLLQFARKGEYVYGEIPSEKVRIMSEGIAKSLGREPEFVNPYFIKRLDCSVVHGQLGKGTCEINAIKRWLRAFVDASLIYLPVHLFPQLIFNLPKVTLSPSASILHILFAASRSSAFLATFISSIYYSVCFSRTRLASILKPFISQQSLDSGLCTAFACLLCGFSLLLENKRRRLEMSLYCAPRALYTLFVSSSNNNNNFNHGINSTSSSRWIEKIIFSFSTGIVMTSMIHRPDLVSGFVRGVLGKVTGDWNGNGKRKGK